MKKLQLEIYGSGVQVTAHILSKNGIKRLEENRDKGYLEDTEIIIEEESEEILITNGIETPFLSTKAFLDGKEIPSSILEISEDHADLWEELGLKENEINEIVIPRVIELELQNNGIEEMLDKFRTLKSTDFITYWGYPWDENYTTFYQHIPAKSRVFENNTNVAFKIIPYREGRLHAAIDVDDGFLLNQVRLLKQFSDVEDSELTFDLYYDQIYWDLYNQVKDVHKSFDEITIHGFEYEGNRCDFDLDFSGGNGWYQFYFKEDDSWCANFSANSYFES